MTTSANDPAATVMAFLRELEARDIPAATARTGPGFVMEFPGPATFTTFAELIEWGRQRYSGVRKTFDRIDVSTVGETVTVHISGALAGKWPDGESFAGIRYLDRFDLQNGLIVRQTVWNDMGEARLARAAAARAAAAA